MGDLQVQIVDVERLRNGKHPFQSLYWARVKGSLGWEPFAFSLSYCDEQGQKCWEDVVLVLSKRLPVGLCLSYVPFGPTLDHCPITDNSTLRDFSRAIKKYLPKPTMFVRYDLPWESCCEDTPKPMHGRSFRVCKESVQPEGTSIIDLTDGYSAVSQRYRQRATRNIRKAKEHHVQIRAWNTSEREFNAWYQVYLETANRDGFSTRSKGYMRRLLEYSTEEVSAELYIALVHAKVVGGAIVLQGNEIALYLYGASKRIEGVSPSYALQDFAIQQACALKALRYDLYGISGPHKRGAHLASLRLFKRSFGGDDYYRPPTFDYVYTPFFRYLYILAEQTRYAMHRKKHPRRLTQQFSVSVD